MKLKILTITLAPLLALCACLSSCESTKRAPVASVSRSMSGPTVTTYHDPHAAFYNSLKDVFPR